MKRHSLLICAFMLFCAVLFTACRERQSLDVTKSLMVFSYAGGNDFFNIEANCDWSIDADGTGDWVTINPLTGSNNATVAISVSPNNTYQDRNTSFTVYSANGKIHREVAVAQSKIDINPIVEKVWFLRFYERWNHDFWGNYIPESYRTWTYFSDIQYDNWFLYFADNESGYQIHTKDGDTVFHPYHYEYQPEYDSLIIAFETTGENTEDYHAIIHELTQSNFSFSNAYTPRPAAKVPQYFEKLNMVNVSTGKRNTLKVNPKKVQPKPSGPLIQLP